jgi:hypothetical protein
MRVIKKAWMKYFDASAYLHVVVGVGGVKSINCGVGVDGDTIGKEHSNGIW